MEDKNVIFLGIKLNSTEMINKALEAGVDINTADNQGCPPLIVAVSCESDDIVQLLIAKGADVNCVFQGYSPLMVAAENGLINISNSLIEANADINAHTADGLSVLMAASRDGFIDLVKKLLSIGVDVRAKTDGGSTALMIAKQFKQHKVIEVLEKHLGIFDYGVSSELSELSEMIDVVR